VWSVKREIGSVPRRSSARAVAVAVIAPLAATLLGLPFESFGTPEAASIYMFAVVVAAAIGGLWSGIVAAILGFLGMNFFFTAPLHTFRVDKEDDLVALFVFLAVATVVGALVGRATREAERAARREREAGLLTYVAIRLLSGEPLDRVLRDFASALVDALDLARCEITADSVEVRAERPEKTEGVAERVPIVAGDDAIGMLIAVSREGEGFGRAERGLLEACVRQVAVALERGRMDASVREARVESEASRLRAALFSSVTHDLRTPLASIKAAVTSLLDPETAHDDAQEEALLRTVLEETDRLNRLVGNILDLARIRAGALVPAREPTAIDEILEAVIARMRDALSAFRVRTVIRPDLPDASVDPVQIDQVLTNLLENAARYSPTGSEILVSVGPWHDAVQVRIVDQGPGVPSEDRELVFQEFFRRDAGSGRGGTGLGLAISRAIVQAHGGRIWLEGAPTGGTAVVFEVPGLRRAREGVR